MKTISRLSSLIILMFLVFQAIHLEAKVNLDFSYDTGGGYNCSILTGKMFCFGPATNHSIIEINIGRPFLSLSTSGTNSCGIARDGSLNCWEWSFSNDQSQSLDVQCATLYRNIWEKWGAKTEYHTNCMRHSDLRNVDRDIAYSAISVGEGHSCAITSGGDLKCWGLNNYGQLGASSSVPSSPTPIAVDPGTKYSNVSARGQTSCGVTASGILKCWGRNDIGQIGDGSSSNRISPVVIDRGTSYREVSTSGFHTCALTTAGSVKCWGHASFALGYPLRTRSECHLNSNRQYVCRDVPVGNEMLPKVSANGELFSQIATSNGSTCAINSGGVLKCWGGISGSLSPQIVDPGTAYSSVRMGPTHSCGKAQSGLFKCWGRSYGG